MRGRDLPAVLGGLTLAAVNVVRGGIVRPMRPDRAVRAVHAVWRWGPTLPGALGAAVAICGEATAVIDERRRLSFRDLDERSARLAAALADEGFTAGDRVGLLCRNHAGAVEASLAVTRLGADLVLLNTGMAAAAIREVLDSHRVRLTICDEEFETLLDRVGAAGAAVRVLAWTDTDASTAVSIDTLIRRTRVGRSPYPPQRRGRLIVLTSGTTGRSRGATRPDPHQITDVSGPLARVRLRAQTPTLIAAPLFHTWGLAGLQVCLATRATAVLTRRFDPEQTLSMIAAHRCSQLIAVPVMLTRILEVPAEVRERYDTGSLRTVACSGSALPSATVTGIGAAFGDVLHNLYGSTEVSWVSVATPADLRAAPTTAGRAPAGTRVAILDRAGRPVRPGDTGRIFAANGLGFGGYTDGGTRESHDGLVATGDLGHLDAGGLLFVDGREDDMVVSGGENVFPGAVEDVLVGRHGIREAAVIGVPDAIWGQRLAAFVVSAPGAGLDADGVRELVRARLARHAVPREVTFMDALPRNATGKVLTRELRERR